MKKTTVAMLILAFGFLMMLTVFPATAEPATFTEFTATQTPSAKQPPSPDLVTRATNGETLHVRNLNGAGTIVGSIPELASGSTSSVIMVQRHASGEGDLGIVKFEMTWTFGDNTFEGNIIGKVIGQNAYSTLHGVVQGTNDFKGNTILLDGTKPAMTSPFSWTGTLIKP